MRLALIFLIILTFLNDITYAQEYDFLPAEKNVFSDNEKSRAEQWKALRKVDTLVDQISGNVTSLSFFSNLMDSDERTNSVQKIHVGFDQDELRIQMHLLKAQDYLYLGDPLVAKDIVLKELNKIDSRKRDNLIWAYKILFEANRVLRNHTDSTYICLKVLSIYDDKKNAFSDKWKLSCSLEFFYEAKSEKKRKKRTDFKESLLSWGNSPHIKRDSFYMPLSAVFIAQSYRYIYPNNSSSIVYLEDAIAHTKNGNKNLNRAYLALALLKFEMKKKDESLSIIRYLSGDFKGYGANIKFFEMDDSGHQIARLCLARLHAAVGNLKAAETWYRDVLLEQKITGNDFVKNEKKKAHWEFAQILYAQKKYLESAKEYRASIQNNFFNHSFITSKNFDENNKKIRTSNIMLAKILSKTSEKNYEAEVQLLELIGYAEADIEFLKKSKDDSEIKKGEYVQNLIALSSLALEYGLESKEAKNVIYFRAALLNMENEISILRTDLANALNAADYTYTGIIETRAISALVKLSPILDKLKQILISLDLIESGLWKENSVGIEYSKKHRFELLRRIYAMDDEISRFRLKEEIEDKIYNPKSPGALQLVGKSINQLSAEIAGMNFLFQYMDQKIPKEIPNEMLDFLENDYSSYEREKLNDEFVKVTVESRYFQLSRNLQENMTFQFQRREKILEKSFFELQKLHKRNRPDSVAIGDIELYNSLDRTWKNTLSAYNSLTISVENIKEKIISERREIITKIDYINQYLTDQENEFDKLKEKIQKEYGYMSMELATQLIPRVASFKEYIQIEVASHNKSIFDIKTQKNKEILKSAEEREKWLNSLRESSKWELMR